MAKDDKKDAAPTPELSPEVAAAKSKKKKLLLIIVGGVVLVAGIAAGIVFFMLGGKPEAELTPPSTPVEAAAASGPSEAKAKEGHDEAKTKEDHGAAKKTEGEPKVAAKASAVDFGDTTKLQPFHLNLGNPLENRYIRLELAVEMGGGDEEQKKEFEKRTPQLRDAIIAVTSRKTREFLLGPDGKEQLRKEILNRINQYMTKKVDDVFITDILIE